MTRETPQQQAANRAKKEATKELQRVKRAASCVQTIASNPPTVPSRLGTVAPVHLAHVVASSLRDQGLAKKVRRERLTSDGG